MPTYEKQFGTNPPTKVIEFGDGDIEISRTNPCGIAFSSISPGKIGEYTGTTNGDLEKLGPVSVLLRFKKPESIDVLIEELLVIRADLVKVK